MKNKEALNIDEIHEGTLQIIRKFSEICNSLNVNYYVAWGSLIGTIRHKGFIPWDDDFDVIMLRPDYDKFIAYCENNQTNLYPFKLFNRNVCKDYPYTISRFEDMRYEAIYDNLIQYDSGMFIDIYPFDGAGVDENEAKRQLETKRKILSKLVAWSISNEFTKPKNQNILKTFFKFVGFKFAHLIGKDYFLNKFEELANTYSYNDSTLVGCLCWDSDLLVFDKKLFEESINVPFENIAVKIPKGYDAILKKTYGDYMKLPNEKDRIPTHGYALFKR